MTQEAKDASAALRARQEIESRQFLLERKRKALEAQIAALQLELETEEQESRQLIAQEEMKLTKFEQDRDEMARSRSQNASSPEAAGGERQKRVEAENEDSIGPGRRPANRRRKMGFEAVCRGTNPEIVAGVRQPEADLRGTPGR